MEMNITPRRKGYRLETGNFTGDNGERYMVYRDEWHERYHVFLEVESKQAARACGAKDNEEGTRTTWQMWEELWHEKTKYGMLAD